MLGGEDAGYCITTIAVEVRVDHSCGLEVPAAAMSLPAIDLSFILR